VHRAVLLAAILLVGCPDLISDPPPTPTPAVTPAPPTPAPTPVTAPLTCPDGTTLRGAPPPHGTDEYCTREDGTRHGPYRIWSADDDVLIVEGAYSEGLRSGPHTMWVEDGAHKAAEGSYAADELDGVWTSWWAADARRSEVPWIAGSKEGPAKGWYAGGQLASAGTYTGGKASGEWVLHHPDGHRWATGTCGPDGPADDWRCFDATGAEAACPEEFRTPNTVAAPCALP